MFDPLTDRAVEVFRGSFSGSPEWVAQAPGRVELLGNHTDYHGGWVLACAVDRRTVVVGRACPDRRIRVVSANLGQRHEFDLDGGSPGRSDGWERYLRGVVWGWTQTFGPPPTGFDAAVFGDVPLGAGLSSSASFQVALLWFLAALASRPPRDDTGRMALARLAQRVENEFVGVACGLLDPFCSVMGTEGHVLALDCRSLDFQRVPLGGPPPALVVCDSMTSRQLASGMYNLRRSEAERVLDQLRALEPDRTWASLRDVTDEDLDRHERRLDPTGLKRARHVLGENRRVGEGVRALHRGDVAELGRLMSASHESSRTLFENSSPALDALIDAAREAPGSLGGKLSGAGWAGCTVHLVEDAAVDAFGQAVAEGIARRSGTRPVLHPCRVASGASCRRVATG